MSNYPFTECPYSTCPYYLALRPYPTILHKYSLYTGLYFPCGSLLFEMIDKKGNLTDFGKHVSHTPNRYAANVILHKETNSSSHKIWQNSVKKKI